MTTKTKERYRITKVDGGGERVVDAKPSEKSETAESKRVMDRPCTRCRFPIGRDVFVRVAGVLHPDGIYHLRCVSV